MDNLQPGELESQLGSVDALTTQLIAWAAPVRFEVARTPADIEAAYRLRYRVALERGWATAADLPDGLERDTYDDRAMQITAVKDGEPVGLTRLVFPSPGLRLPTEEIYNVDIEPHGQVVEISRTTVIVPHSEIQHRIFGGLLSRAWHEIRARGYYRFCGYAALPLLQLYSFMGIKFTHLGAPQVTWKETRYPIRFEVVASAPELVRRYGKASPRASNDSQ